MGNCKVSIGLCFGCSRLCLVVVLSRMITGIIEIVPRLRYILR